MTGGRIDVCWIFSLARCGSSIAAYAAAAPFAAPVADEPFGPWDRTGEPYHYPPEQDRLRRLFWDSGEHLTEEVVDLAERLFEKIAGRSGRVVSKHPHTMIDPDEFRDRLGHHKAVHLLRNPLMRLNSLYVRGWTGSIGESHDLTRFKTAARRWLDSSHRFTFEELRADPADFFRRLWTAWGWPHDDSHVAAALEYQNSHYHASSAQLGSRRPSRPLSEKRLALPEEAIELYLADPFVRDLMERVGWSTDPGAYRARAGAGA